MSTADLLVWQQVRALFDSIIICCLMLIRPKLSNKKKKRKEKLRTRSRHKDPEIDQLLRIYGEDRVKIVYDSDP